MAQSNKNLFKISKSGLEADLREKLSFWQLFAIISLIVIAFAAVIIAAIFIIKSSLVLLAGLPMATILGKWVKKLFGSRSP